MLGQNPTLQARTIVDATQAVGAKLPASVARTHQTTISALSALHDIYPKGGLAPAVASALRAGRDPATDPEVQRIHLAMQLGEHGISAGVENILIEETRQAFHTHADAIVQAWATPFTKAAGVLAQAFNRLGGIDLTDTGAVVQQGGDAAEVWGKAQTASQTLSTIASAWISLVEFTRTANLDQRYPALRLAAVDAETWRALELERKRVSAWDLVISGLPLSLPTPIQYRERVAQLERGMAELAMREAPMDNSRESVRQWARKMAASA